MPEIDLMNTMEVIQNADGLERRTLGEIRMPPAADGARPGTMTGHAARFNTIAKIGNFVQEQIKPGAFTRAIQHDDVRALIDHNSSLILGRNRAGTLRLAEDDLGLRIEIDPPDTSYANDLLTSIRRGDVSQMSFGFRALKETWDDTQDPPLRTLEEVELFDVSPVTFPAYANTEISVRAFQHAGAVLRAENEAEKSAILARMKMRQAMAERHMNSR